MSASVRHDHDDDIGPEPSRWRPIKTVPSRDMLAWIRWRHGAEEICDLSPDTDPGWWERAGATHWRIATDEEVASFCADIVPLPSGPQRLAAFAGIIAILATGAACMAATTPVLIKDTNPAILPALTLLSVVSFIGWIAAGYFGQRSRR
jgi:hypothetical protein